MDRNLQYELFGDRGRSRDDLVRFLNEGSSPPVEVKFTRNRVTMISVEFHPDGPVALRLHEHFLKAPDEVLADLRKYLRSRRRAAWSNVCAYARQISGGEELVAAEVRVALDELGKVAGDVYTDDVLDRIFSRFCIGK